MKWGPFHCPKPPCSAGVSKLEAVLFPVSDWRPQRPAAGGGDVGPAVHHVYEVRGLLGMEGGRARMNDREGGASMSDRWLGPA